MIRTPLDPGTLEVEVDRDLVEQARRGDHEAFAVLVHEVSDSLYAVAFRILRDAGLAEDALQNALVIAWRRIPHLREPDRLEAWLHRILVHACYDESQRARHWTANVRVLPVNGPSTPDSSRSFADRDELEQLVRRVTHCRLETHPGFFDFFVEGCQFGPVGEAERAGEAAAP